MLDHLGAWQTSGDVLHIRPAEHITKEDEWAFSDPLTQIVPIDAMPLRAAAGLMDREAPRELASSDRRWLTRAQKLGALWMDAGPPSGMIPSPPGSPMPASAFASSGATRWDRAAAGAGDLAATSAGPRRSRWGPSTAPALAAPHHTLRGSGGGQSGESGLVASRPPFGPPFG